MKQKFHKHDLVRVANPLPVTISHFGEAGRLAYVLYSYEDKYPHESHADQEPDYALELRGRFKAGSFSAWYPQSVLTLVKRRKRCPTCRSYVRSK